MENNNKNLNNNKTYIIRIGSENNGWLACAECMMPIRVGLNMPKICPRCGKKIDWTHKF